MKQWYALYMFLYSYSYDFFLFRTHILIHTREGNNQTISALVYRTVVIENIDNVESF